MTFIFLIQFGDWIAKINNPYSMTAAVLLGAFWVLKHLTEKPHSGILSAINKGMAFCFVIAVLGLFVTVALSFMDNVNMNSKYERELAMIENISGEYNGLVNGKTYQVKIQLDSMGNERPIDKINICGLSYEIKPSDLTSPEIGRGKLYTQRTNFWEGKNFIVDFSNSQNFKNMAGDVSPQVVGDIKYYRISFNQEKNFLLKKLN